MPSRRLSSFGLSALLGCAPVGCSSSSAAPSEGAFAAAPASDRASPNAGIAAATADRVGSDAVQPGQAPAPSPSTEAIERSLIPNAFEGASGAPPLDAGAAEPAAGRLDLVEATLAELRVALAQRIVTPAELLEMYRARVAAFDLAGPALNSFLTLSDGAVADANALGTRCAQAGAPALCGIPVILKDNIDTLDLPTTAGSVALEGSLPARDAFITRRLREAGAVIIGKATLTELANFLTAGMPSGYSSLGGFGFNPYDPRPLPGGDGRPVLTPGGSSSGSSIAVSANLAAVGVGTETSGSILSPASSNGIVGIKPTLGLVSRSGIIPISADQDTAGPLARTVTDAAILLGVLAGYDADDPATRVCQVEGVCPSDYTPFLDAEALSGARLAVAPVPQGRGAVIAGAIAVLEARGARVEALAGSLPPVLGTCSSVPPAANCSTVLLYGFKRDLNAYLAATPGAPVRTLAELIAFNAAAARGRVYGQVLAIAAEALDVSVGSADTQRYEAERARDLAAARRALDGVYAGADGVSGTDDDVDAIIFSENAGAALPAIAGYPSVTVPGGFLPPAGAIQNPFPSGVTFSGPAFSEPRLIALGYAYEQATRHRAPPASAPPLPTDSIQR